MDHSPNRPNILFLLTDDQRFDTIGALGNPFMHTPNMDRLVEKGVSFELAHISGGDSCGGMYAQPGDDSYRTGAF